MVKHHLLAVSALALNTNETKVRNDFFHIGCRPHAGSIDRLQQICAAQETYFKRYIFIKFQAAQGVFTGVAFQDGFDACAKVRQNGISRKVLTSFALPTFRSFCRSTIKFP